MHWFYNNYFKALYCFYFAIQRKAPVEMLFELNAAFDHIASYRPVDTPEAFKKNISAAFGHLKRGCLDAFKIGLNTALEQVKELKRVDLSSIDNGDFLKNFNALVTAIRVKAILACSNEGKTTVGLDKLFEQWQDVFVLCRRLEEEFYTNKHINWGNTYENRRRQTLVLGGVSSVLRAGLLAFIQFVYKHVSFLFHF